MTAATADTQQGKPRRGRKAAPAFDPYTATFDGERPSDDGLRLAYRCPSRTSAEAHLLTTDEDGGTAWCSCPGYYHNGTCTHAKQATVIARLALTNHYATLAEDALRALDCGAARGSLRHDILGDEVGKRARMQDKALLSARARQARAELFGDGS